MECIHEWIVLTNDYNEPVDIMCSECKEVIMFKILEDDPHSKKLPSLGTEETKN